MKTTLITLAIAAALGTLAGCDRNTEQRSPTTASPAPAPQAGAGASSPREATTPSTPANTGKPSPGEKAEGSNPTQQQVDPKEREQQRDFKMNGDGAGPKPGG